MSDWVHVRGGFELSGSVFNSKTDPKTGRYTNVSVPYPDEQIVIEMPEPFMDCFSSKKKSTAALQADVDLYSLPRCKPIIEKAMSMLPSGEYDMIQHYEYQPVGRFRSSSSSERPYVVKQAAKKLEKMYSGIPFKGMTYDEMKKYWHFRFSWFEFATDMTLSISDDVRYVGGEEFMLALIKALQFMKDNGVDVTDGYLEWTDDWDYRYRFAARCEDGMKYMLLDPKTNAVIASKYYHETFDSKLGEDKTVIEKTGDWDKLMPYLEAQLAKDAKAK